MATKTNDHEERIAKLEQAMAQIATIAEAVERHEVILKGGDSDGTVGLLERIRKMENAINSASRWLSAIAMLFLAQFIAVIFGVISFFVQIAPALMALADK